MKKQILPFFLLLIALFPAKESCGQRTVFNTDFTQEGMRKSANPESYYGDMEGSPYYNDWAKGMVKLDDGNIYMNILLRYDEINGILIFKTKPDDTARLFKARPLEFKLSYITDNKQHKAHFLSRFETVDDSDTTTFYQVLSYGNVQLLKRTVKSILKYSQFNSGQMFRRVEEHDFYYLCKDNKPVRIKKEEKAVLSVLTDKATQLRQFISTNKPDLKQDDDLIKFIDYYNSL